MSEYTTFDDGGEHGFDPITGLPSEDLFIRQCERAAIECKRRGVPLGIIALSIDGVEDRVVWYPLEAASLLQAVSRRLRSEMRAEFFFSRVGNLFFAVLPATDEERTAALGRHLVEGGMTLVVDDAEMETTGCAGTAAIARWSEPLEDLRKVFARSVAALQVARRRGSSTFSTHSFALERQRARERRIERGLRSAMREGDLLLLYQPIVDVATRRVVAVEALVRWAHPVFGVVSPGEFVPVAERLGYAQELDLWVVERALEELPVMLASFPGLEMHVNISAEHLNLPNAADALIEAVESKGAGAQSIVFEITESSSAERTQALNANVLSLRKAGIRIAIDDIGTGFNSLGFFVNVPCDTVKIDRGLVPADAADETRLAVLEGVMSVCKRLGVAIVAEGIETAQQHAILQSLGVAYAQGFFYGYPMPAARLGEGTPFPT